MFYFRLKSFNLIKWHNNVVIMIEKSYFGNLTRSHSRSLVAIRGHS